MITGFNTDVEHDGTVYHVQTEDKGLDSPLILSLVYVGGAILASKRSLYHDLIAEGFDEATLAERLHRQHKLICAAIHAGRIEDLKRMNQREPVEARPAPPLEPHESPVARAAPNEPQELSEPQNVSEPPPQSLSEPLLSEPLMPVQPAPVPAPSVEAAAEPPAPTGPLISGAKPSTPVDVTRAVAAYNELHLDLLEERDLRGGDFVTFRIRVSSGSVESRDAVPDADVVLKVLGTAFKPLVCSARTDQDGVAILFAGLPRFTNGRAAILIRASSHGCEAELRRIIQPA
ncbi:MAG TPA: hypothetical protein VGO91_04090 [Pyrinomonadaceae bacterium]|nr:hypothetical protein [Pyrinomonadaceae bacterium]